MAVAAPNSAPFVAAVGPENIAPIFSPILCGVTQFFQFYPLGAPAI